MWYYKGKTVNDIEDLGKDVFGFIYVTTHIHTGKKYIGKKSLQHNIKKKLTKKQIAEQTGPGRRKVTEKVQKESDWKTYYGSSEFIKNLIKEGKQDELSREIIQVVSNKKLLTYYEMKHLFMNEVLENQDKWLNDNIQGHFFSKDFL
jgi:hypothetical protein